MAASVDRCVGLRGEVIFFAIAREVLDLISHTSVLDFAIRRFDETKLVDSRESRHRANETDVWTFRRFDRANPAVVRRMHVAHFESGAIARETAGTESRETTLVRQFRQRVRLVHELGKLRAAEEIADNCAERLRID